MLVAKQNDLHLGEVKFGSQHNFSYYITNTGQQRVDLTSLTAGCGACTKAVISSNYLNPGQTIRMDVEFNPNSTGIGIKKNITLQYKEGEETRNLVVSFKSNVVE